MKRILLVTVIVTYIAVSVLAAFRESLTFDEPVHIQVGLDALYQHIFIKDPYSPPLVSEIASLPYVSGIDVWITNSPPSIKALPSRMMIIILSLLLLIVLYVVVKKTIGEPEALSSVFLFVWEPSILAHNHYVTKDMGFTLFFFLVWTLFLALCRKYSLKIFLGFSVLFGCMLASKTSAIPFFLFSVLILALVDGSYREKILHIGWRWLLICCIGLCVVWACYFFQTDVFIAKRDDPNRISSRLMRYANQTNNAILANILKFGTNVRIPLGAYLASQKNGLLLQKEQESVFFLGQKYTGVRWYMIDTQLLLKLPIPLIVFGVLAFYLILSKKMPLRKYFPYIAPIVGISLFLSASHARPYVRYMLPMYPFLFVIASGAIVYMIKRKWAIIPAMLCVWYMIGTLLYFPHFISFANIFAGIRTSRYEKLIDSDIDWGQELFDVDSYIKKNNISNVRFSYFGTDDGALYGLQSTVPYGSVRLEDICAFHDVKGEQISGKSVTAISLSNWYYCGYYKTSGFMKDNITGFIGDTILLFPAKNP